MCLRMVYAPHVSIRTVYLFVVETAARGVRGLQVAAPQARGLAGVEAAAF